MQPDATLPRSFVGLKQSTEAIKTGIAKKAYIAQDADEYIIAPFCELCKETKTPVEMVETKAKLGKIFGISVPAAVAVEIK